jgi:hypothetical protein
LHESGLAIRRKSMLPGDGIEADSLERIALVQMRVERYQAASTNLQRPSRFVRDPASRLPCSLTRSSFWAG